MAFNAEALRLALERIQSFRTDPEAKIPCPSCEAVGLRVEDRSSRPYAEWYYMSCTACGLDETIHIPLGPPVMGGYD